MRKRWKRRKERERDLQQMISENGEFDILFRSRTSKFENDVEIFIKAQ